MQSPNALWLWQYPSLRPCPPYNICQGYRRRIRCRLAPLGIAYGNRRCGSLRKSCPQRISCRARSRRKGCHPRQNGRAILPRSRCLGRSGCRNKASCRCDIAPRDNRPLPSVQGNNLPTLRDNACCSRPNEYGIDGTSHRRFRSALDIEDHESSLSAHRPHRQTADRHAYFRRPQRKHLGRQQTNYRGYECGEKN